MVYYVMMTIGQYQYLMFTQILQIHVTHRTATTVVASPQAIRGKTHTIASEKNII